MGRPLFSEKYAPRTPTEPIIGSYEKWSRWNYFDPDSDEFFQNAQREVFTDTEEYHEEIRNLVILDDGGGSPAASESSEGDRRSPMALGPNDPAILISDAYSSADWEHRFLVAGAAELDWRRVRVDNQPNETPTYPHVIPVYIPRGFRNTPIGGSGEQVRSVRINRPRSATVSSVFLPPSSLRNSTTATEVNAEASDQPPSAGGTVTITPINLPTEPSTPGPILPETPSTPTDNVQLPQLLTPSPPPSVAPHVYTWNRRAMAVPASPLAVQGAGGPLTNPNARMSLAHVNIIHSPIRVQNAAV